MVREPISLVILLSMAVVDLSGICAPWVFDPEIWIQATPHGTNCDCAWR